MKKLLDTHTHTHENLAVRIQRSAGPSAWVRLFKEPLWERGGTFDFHIRGQKALHPEGQD